MSQQNEQLILCPFCRGKARISRHDGDERVGYNITVTIICNDCGASLPTVSENDKNGWCCESAESTTERAIHAWNTRHAPGQVGVPDGWKLVPKELTLSMSVRGKWALCDHAIKPEDFKRAWREMLIAAPQPPEGMCRKPRAWLHILHAELDQNIEQPSMSKENPFGRCGVDYDPSYTVTSVPLYSIEEENV